MHGVTGTGRLELKLNYASRSAERLETAVPEHDNGLGWPQRWVSYEIGSGPMETYILKY